MKTKDIRRQLFRCAGGQDLWPRKSEAHRLHALKGCVGGHSQEWHLEFVRRGLGDQLAGPTGKLP
jgi:hypothetical protein